MMQYEVFKEVIKEKFLDYLPEKYSNCEVSIHEVDKVNVTLDGLTVRFSNEDMSVSPTIYINELYEDYKNTGDLQLTLEKAAYKIDGGFFRGEEIGGKLDLDNARDKVVFQLINTEQNQHMLQRVPHREWKDLSIIYRLVVDMDDQGIASTIIHNNLAESLGFDEEQLYKMAVENMKRMFPPTITSMNEIVGDIFMREGMSEEMADIVLRDTPPEKQMYVLSNELKINGATSMLYEDQLNSIAEIVGDDLYILPSSLHEVIAVAAGNGDPEELARMVEEINMNQVRLEERLSNQVYHYDKDLRVLNLATETPKKRLDGMVADNSIVYETKEHMR